MASEFLRVTEIFNSIQGESSWAGLPCTFVRLTGCPLRCVWCDTEYAFQGGEQFTHEEILEQVASHETKLVEITGGEPLVHKGAFTLAKKLLDEGYTVLVETSGAMDISPLDERVHVIMDLKCPGSGEESKNLWSNLEHLDARDEVKFVIKDRADYEWARKALKDHDLDRRLRSGTLKVVLFSPVWDEQDPLELAQWILEDHLPVRLQLQVHKILHGGEVPGT